MFPHEFVFISVIPDHDHKVHGCRKFSNPTEILIRGYSKLGLLGILFSSVDVASPTRLRSNGIRELQKFVIPLHTLVGVQVSLCSNGLVMFQSHVLIAVRKLRLIMHALHVLSFIRGSHTYGVQS